MRIELPREVERFGPIMIHDVQKVYELDSGLIYAKNESKKKAIRRISYESFHKVEEDMVIVIPVKNERIKLLEGVLLGIPAHCQIIVISNSPRGPIDRFMIEKKALERMASFMGKDILVFHQKDPELALACEAAGYTAILDDDGVVRNGKAEGMILATFLGMLTGKKYIGFIDSDNYFPGAVHEYVKEYAAGFLMAHSKYSMVRISWHSKPKIIESSLFFAKRGRASEHTNKFLNRLVSSFTGFGTEIIKTGNAGEHAMSLELASQLDYSSGYSIEPYHYVGMLERFGGIIGPIDDEVMNNQIEIFQIESRNPHLHEVKGDEHVKDMSYAALESIYRSPITPQGLKEEILEDIYNRNLLNRDEPFKNTIKYYPSIRTSNVGKFQKSLQNHPYYEFLSGDVSGYSEKVDEIDRTIHPENIEETEELGQLEIK